MKTHFFKTCTIIGICLLFSANSYGQTKEETITWLTKKLGKYVVTKNDDYKNVKISITPCEIVVYYGFGGDKWQLIIPTDGVTFIAKGISTNGERITD